VKLAPLSLFFAIRDMKNTGIRLMRMGIQAFHTPTLKAGIADTIPLLQ
jgi:hypothetical protein